MSRPADLPAPRVSLRDLAHELGVSPASVSRALNNHPKISAALKRRVRSAADSAGYRPDPMLRSLAHYRRAKATTPIASSLAWINHWPEPARLRSFREFDLYWRGATTAALRHGFHLEEFIWGDAGLSLERLRTVLLARNVRGLLVPPHPNIELDWSGFDWTPFCVVRFGHSIASPAAHVVTSNQALNARLAVHSMRAEGYTRCGFVTNTRMTSNTQALAGYLMETHTAAPPRLPPLVLRPEADDAPRRLADWLSQVRPDAILSDIRETRALLEAAGLRVPRDVGLATMSVLDGGADAGIDQRSEEIGRAAVEVLVSCIHNNDTGLPPLPRETLIPGRWHPGKSLPGRTTKHGRSPGVRTARRGKAR